MNWLKQLISDGDQPSTGRVMALIVVVSYAVVWSVLSIKQGAMLVPDTKVISVVIAAFSGKTLQSFAENLTGRNSSALAVTPNPQPAATPPQQ